MLLNMIKYLDIFLPLCRKIKSLCDEPKWKKRRTWANMINNNRCDCGLNTVAWYLWSQAFPAILLRPHHTSWGKGLCVRYFSGWAAGGSWSPVALPKFVGMAPPHLLSRWRVYTAPLSSLIFPLPRRTCVGSNTISSSLWSSPRPPWQITGGLWTDWRPAQHPVVTEGFISPASGAYWTPRRLTLSTALESLGPPCSLLPATGETALLGTSALPAQPLALTIS